MENKTKERKLARIELIMYIFFTLMILLLIAIIL
jgi:hypothetical protein